MDAKHMSTEVKRYLNDGDLLPDERVYVLASDYDSLLDQRDQLLCMLKHVRGDMNAIHDWCVNAKRTTSIEPFGLSIAAQALKEMDETLSKLERS